MKKIKLSTGQEVQLREPKVKDIRIVSNCKTEQEQEIKLIANLTGITEEDIDELSLKDYGLISKELQSFL